MIFFCKGKLYLSPSLFNDLFISVWKTCFKNLLFMTLIQMKNLEFWGFLLSRKKRTSNIWWNNSLSYRARESRGFQQGESSLGDQNRARASLQHAAAAAATSLQSCPTLCDPIDSSHQPPLSLGFFRQEHWSRLPFSSPMHESEKWKWSHSVMSDSSWPCELLPTRLLHPWDFPGERSGVGCHCLLQLAV